VINNRKVSIEPRTVQAAEVIVPLDHTGNSANCETLGDLDAWEYMRRRSRGAWESDSADSVCAEAAT
jgi:hypothetical protein